MSKPRFATAWLGGCSGCHMSFLDLDERLLDLARIVDVCYTPIADVKDFPDNVDITLVEGAVANIDHLDTLHAIRARTRILVAFGDCAITGNVTAMRNLFSVDDVLNRAYRDGGVFAGFPQGNGLVPELLPRVLRIHDVVKVDYFLQGCPPSAGDIYDFLSGLLGGQPMIRPERRFGQ
jgi:NAD-reducing hydrogenase small subunit